VQDVELGACNAEEFKRIVVGLISTSRYNFRERIICTTQRLIARTYKAGEEMKRRQGSSTTQSEGQGLKQIKNRKRPVESLESELRSGKKDQSSPKHRAS
jgi:hypothetical protein